MTLRFDLRLRCSLVTFLKVRSAELLGSSHDRTDGLLKEAGMGMDTGEQREAAQVWMELELRETWRRQVQSAGCMGASRYYILHNGKVSETDFPAWAAWVYTHQAEPLLRQTRVEAVEINTVFLSFDQGYVGGGPSILFETTVVGGPLNGQRAQYYLMDDALVGHEAMVERVKREILAGTS
jgi:hypothetical protein